MATPKKKSSAPANAPKLFAELPPLETDSETLLKQLDRPVWTECKAKLIERYVYYFLMVTKHGVYIDGFAGPQRAQHTDMWTASLILDLEPRWLRHFYLCDLDKSQYVLLKELKEKHEEHDGQIHIHNGDCNEWIPSILPKIKHSEAVFCLLDQRTFECHWSTVDAVARHKEKDKNKIEIFYFLPNAWLARAMAALQDERVVELWWGRKDWQQLKGINSVTLQEVFTRRFKDLGYKSVKAWPIYDRKDGQRVMYWMIHSTDHPEAPKLMRRAYQRAVTPMEPIEQIKMEFGS